MDQAAVCNRRYSIYLNIVQLKLQWEKYTSKSDLIRAKERKKERDRKNQLCSKSLPFCFPITQINHKVLCAYSFVALFLLCVKNGISQ